LSILLICVVFIVYMIVTVPRYRRNIDYFAKVHRRTHLYLGLVLMPLLLMYGLSSFIIIHQTWFGLDKPPQWEPLYEKEYHRPISNEADLRATVQQILRDCNLEGAFWTDKPNPDTL